MDSDTRVRLVKCFRCVFPRLSDEEIPLASKASVASWDSMAAITLISVVEEEFHLQVLPREFERFASFELIRHFIEERS